MQRLRWIALLIACAPVSAACGGKVFLDPPGQGGGGASGSSSSSTTSSSSTSSSATTSGGCGGPSSSGFFPCSPKPPCNGGSTCLALADNQGPVASFRMAHITFESPNVFGKGVVGTVLQQASEPNLPACGLNSGGTFNWLLQLDPGTSTLRMGGAKPVASPEAGYSFLNESLQGFSAVPVVTPLAGNQCGPFSSTPAPLLTIPVFLDSAASQALPMPIRQISISNVVLSPDHNCIGAHNAAGLDPSNNCLPDLNHPLFLDGGSFHGFFSLEDADAMSIATLAQSLCVLLSGDPNTFGDGGAPIEKCKRDPSGQIIFAGDWCSSDTPASPMCHDAMNVGGTFAASAVTILN